MRAGSQWWIGRNFVSFLGFTLGTSGALINVFLDLRDGRLAPGTLRSSLRQAGLSSSSCAICSDAREPVYKSASRNLRSRDSLLAQAVAGPLSPRRSASLLVEFVERRRRFVIGRSAWRSIRRSPRRGTLRAWRLAKCRVLEAVDRPVQGPHLLGRVPGCTQSGG
jgi:hypothetical protein